MLKAVNFVTDTEIHQFTADIKNSYNNCIYCISIHIIRKFKQVFIYLQAY